MGITLTPFVGLRKQDVGDPAWSIPEKDNYDDIDEFIGASGDTSPHNAYECKFVGQRFWQTGAAGSRRLWLGLVVGTEETGGYGSDAGDGTAEWIGAGEVELPFLGDIVQKWTALQWTDWVPLTIGGGIATIDCELGNYFSLLIDQSTEIRFINHATTDVMGTAGGASFILQVTQSGAGGNVLTFQPPPGGPAEWPYQIAPFNTLTAGEVDYFQFIRSSTGRMHGSWATGYLP